MNEAYVYVEMYFQKLDIFRGKPKVWIAVKKWISYELVNCFYN